MARININLPDDFRFSATLSVRVTDLNYGGHLGNDSVLSLMQEARVQFYQALGFKSEIELDGSIGQIIADAAIVYKSEAFLGDTLDVKIAVNDLNKYGFDMLYLITNQKTNKEVARAKTGIVCFDYEKRKVASVPDTLKSKLGFE
jgi:acyl-CoA thioester hydrolase